ncbi:MAG: hypothetical protein ACRC6V_00695 [Bacteroidales bacterium]
MKHVMFVLAMIVIGGSNQALANDKMEVDCRRAGYDIGTEEDKDFRDLVMRTQTNKLAKTYGEGGKVPMQCVDMMMEGLVVGTYVAGYEINQEDKTPFTDAMELCFDAGWKIERIKLRGSTNYKNYHNTLQKLEATPYRNHNVCMMVWAEGRKQGAEAFEKGE